MKGQFLRRYEIVEKLGEGVMGVVHLARDTRLNRLVAVKVPPIEDVSGGNVSLREAQAASALNHPNIITVYDVSPESEQPAWLVLEYVKGRTPGRRINRNGLSVRDVLRYAAPIADALAAAHEAGHSSRSQAGESHDRRDRRKDSPPDLTVERSRSGKHSCVCHNPRLTAFPLRIRISEIGGSRVDFGDCFARCARWFTVRAGCLTVLGEPLNAREL